MASATVDSSATAAVTDESRHLRFETLPLIDLRLFTQSELYSLSLLSVPSPSPSPSSQDDVVVPIPKIDRSVFNESAGSRKQTYFRLRLAPRTTANPPHPSAAISRQKNPESLEEENSRIISLLKDLFAPHAESKPPIPSTPEGESSLVAVPVTYDECVPESSSSVLQSIPIGIVDLGFNDRKRGRPKKLQTSSVSFENLSEEKEILVFDDNENENWTENGSPVAVRDLDHFEEELKWRTEGMRTEEELSGFLTGLSGEWGSRRKKRKIVDARSLGDMLPLGWKLLLSIKSDGNQVWLGCSRYISPDGQQFVSSKDVSAHLFSSSGVQDATHDSSVPADESSWLGCKMISENSADPTLQMEQNQNEVICFSAVPISSIPADQNEAPLPMSGSPGKPLMKESYRCHKCTMTFEEKDNLLLHLLSSHKKSRGARSSATDSDSMIMKDGKYECQLCHKLFEEKNRFSSHFGNHIKDYVKRVEASEETNLVHRRKQKMRESIAAERISSAMRINTKAVAKSALGFPRAKIESDAIPKTQPCSDGNRVNIPPNEPVAVSERNGEYVTEYTEKQERNSGFSSDNVGVVDEAGKTDAVELDDSKDMMAVSSTTHHNGTSETPQKFNFLENENKASMDSVSSMEDCSQEVFHVNGVFASTENNNAINNESLVNRLFGSPMEDVDVDDGDEIGDNVLISGIEDHCFGLQEGVLNRGTQQMSLEGRSLVRFGHEEKCIQSDDLTGTRTSVLENESGSVSRLVSSGQVLLPIDDQNKAHGDSLQECGSYNSWNGEEAIDFDQNVAERSVQEADTSFPVIPAVNQQTCDFGENVKGFSCSKIQNPWQQQVFENNLLFVHQKSLSPDANVGKISSCTMGNFQFLAESRSDSAVLNRIENEARSGGTLPVAPVEQQAFVLNTNEARGPTFHEPKENRGFTGLYAGNHNRVEKYSRNLTVSNTEEKHKQGESMSSNWNNKSSLGFDSRNPLQHGGTVMGFEAWANPPPRSSEVVTSERRGTTYFGGAIEDLKRKKESAFDLLSPSVDHRQACETGYNLDMFYGGVVPDNRQAGNMGTFRSNEQMNALYNQQQPKPCEEAMAPSMWRLEQNVNVLQNSGLNYVFPSVSQPSNCFPAINMVSDKVQHEFCAGNQKLGSAPAAAGGMRTGSSGGFMEYNFLSAPSSGQGSHISSFNQQICQGFESNWVEKEALGLFPKMGSTGSGSSESRHHQVTALCVCCGNQFSHDGDFDAGDGSVGYMCFNCKAKFAGQINFF